MADAEQAADRPGMVQCDVTGKWVPEDEVITLHGRRVCAEGKAELLERLKSGEGMPGELEHPTSMRRFGSMVLDGMVVTGATLVVGGILGTGMLTGGVGGAGGAGGGAKIAFYVISMLIPTGYFTLMHGKYGQTVGKMAGKIKVVKADGSNIDYRIALLRLLYYQGPAILAALLGVGMVLLSSDAIGLLSGGLNGLAGFYVLVSAACALVDKGQQRAIHDRLAHTRVIRLD